MASIGIGFRLLLLFFLLFLGVFFSFILKYENDKIYSWIIFKNKIYPKQEMSWIPFWNNFQSIFSVLSKTYGQYIYK